MMIEITEGFDADGNPVQTRKAKFLDRHVSLDKLARHLGLLVEKVKVCGDAGNPLHLLIQRIQGSSIRPVIEGVVEREEYDRAA
jgi:hypothetical protein